MNPTDIDDQLATILSSPYSRVFWKDDNGYGASVLEFPGCYAAGPSAEDAMQNLEDAMADWSRSELEAGHGVPAPLGGKNHSGRIHLRIPPSTHERASLLAAHAGVSLNRWLSDVIARATGDPSASPSPAAFRADAVERSDIPDDFRDVTDALGNLLSNATGGRYSQREARRHIAEAAGIPLEDKQRPRS